MILNTFSEIHQVVKNKFLFFISLYSISLIFFLISNLYFCIISTPVVHAAKASPGEYIDVSGRPIYVEQYGKGPPLVMLHGGLATFQSSFENQILAFSKSHQVVAIEQMGHGHTPDANIPFSYEQMAKDTVSVLQALNIKKADIVGWSDGGVLALIIACRYPGLVNHLVISGANTELIGISPKEVKRIKQLSAEDLAKETSPSEQEAYGKVSPDGPGHWPVVVKKVWDMWLTPVILQKSDLAKIHAPVLVICGDNDTIPLEHTMNIFKSLHHAELLVLPSTGHHTFSEASETLNPIILGFLDSN